MNVVICSVLSLLLLACAPLHAREVRTVTDHSGQRVSYPAAPQRIVSLHDWTATVMVHELGGGLIGSTGRLGRDARYSIRSGHELYGLGFDTLAMASVHGMLDMEQIAKLEPDLIIGNLGDTLAYRDQLSLIAPTLIFNPANGREPLDNYRELAGWIGQAQRFDTFKAAYDTRIATLRHLFRMSVDAPPTYLMLQPNAENGQIRIFRHYGALTTVLRDLGFVPTPLTEQVPKGFEEVSVSAEILGELSADYLFTTHNAGRGDTLDNVMAEMERVTGGYRGALPAARHGRFISMSRFHVYPTTFAALNYVLDRLEDMPGRYRPGW
ncbi:MAG: ABC transporter substrate-binding protein [Rhodocyclaceae bacterium]